MEYERVIFTFACICYQVLWATGNDLQFSLMSAYNKNVIPTLINETLYSDVEMHLFAISNFDEISEVISTNFWFDVRWTDHRLRWNVTEYDATETYFRQEQIWHPDLTIVNAVDDYRSVGHKDLLLTVNNGGNVVWEPGCHATTMCEINTELFPFDTQTCFIEMLPWTHRRPYFDVRPSSSTIHLTNYYDNGLWIIKTTYVRTDDLSVLMKLKFTFEIKRRYEYYITSIIIPVLVLSFLNCFSFVLPYDSGEKMTYSTTILLAYTVLLTYTNDTLPKTSKYTSILVRYISIMLCLSCASVVCTLLSMLMRERKDTTTCENCRHMKSNVARSENGMTSYLGDHDSSIKGDNSDNVRNERYDDTSGRDNIRPSSTNRWISILRQCFRFFINYFMFVVVVLTTVVMTATTFGTLSKHND